MSRHIDILNKLKSDSYITSKQIAASLNVSDRTIREDLKELSLIGEKNGFSIVSKPHYGNSIYIFDNDKYEKYLATNMKVPQDATIRMAYVILFLLDNDHHYVSTTKIANQLYISESKVSALIKNIDGILFDFHLNFENKKNHGMHINGTEENKRMCIASILTRFDVSGYFRDIEGEASINSINKVVIEIFDKYNLFLDEVFYDQFIILLFVNIRRIKQNKNICSSHIDQNSYEYKLIKDLFKVLNKMYAIEFSEDEICNLAIRLSGMRNSSSFEIKNANIYIKEDVYALSQKMIETVDSTYAINLMNDFDLQLNLARHLVPMIIRIKYGIIAKNPLKEKIKQKYSFGYQMAIEASKLIENNLDVKINDDEISYLALIFSLSIEKEKRQDNYFQKKNIILVCGSSNGSAHLLKYKYKNEFNAFLNEIEVCSLRDLKDIDFDNFDYIFTTVPIVSTVPIPIVQVGYFLDTKDKEKVINIFNTVKNDVLSEYYAKDQFIPHLKANDRLSVIKEMYDYAKDKYHLNKEYYDSVITREHLAKTAFGNYVAMPHTVESICDENFVYIGILDKPILWENEMVQVVFLTNIGKSRGKNLVKFYDLTMRFFLNDDYVKKLINDKSFEGFIEMLANLDTIE